MSHQNTFFAGGRWAHISLEPMMAPRDGPFATPYRRELYQPVYVVSITYRYNGHTNPIKYCIRSSLHEGFAVPP